MKKIDLFVIDTNTLISAFLLSNSTARKALNKARRLGRVILSEQIADEFKNVFIRSKFDEYLPLEARLEIIDDFISPADFVTPKEIIVACRDQKDDKFLELAVASNATCIITSDQDLLILNPFRDIPILNTTDFLNEFRVAATD